MDNKRRDFFVATINRDKKVEETKNVNEEKVIEKPKQPESYFVSPSGKHQNKIYIIDNSRGNPKQYDFLKGKNTIDLSLISVGEGKDKPLVIDNSEKIKKETYNTSLYANPAIEEDYEEYEKYQEEEFDEEYVDESEKEFTEEISYETPFVDTLVKETTKPVEPVRHTRRRQYHLPSVNDLPVSKSATLDDEEWLKHQEQIINQTFIDFQVKAEVVGKIVGPTVTQFLIKLAPGVHVNNISKLEDNIQLALALPKDNNIRFISQVPNTPYAGIEVPNRKRKTVLLGDLINSKEFKEYEGKLPIAVGLDVTGKKVFVDITEMPHCLIAGTTKSGKSVSLNTIILSLLYRCSPDYLKLILIDPKLVELSTYKGIPHLAMPVITDFEDFKGVMNWIVNEMERRYELLGLYGARSLPAINRLLKEEGKDIVPYLVVVMDEFSDWIINAGADVEKSIQRLASKARACGIHLILAAQRPSSSVINGEIKANFDTRFAFKTSSFDDSKIILGSSGAEKLVGRGDLLLKYAGSEADRIQAAFISDDDGEITSIVNKIRNTYGENYIVDLEDIRRSEGGKYNQLSDEDAYDEMLPEVARFCVENDTGSNQQALLHFKMGYPRANKIFLQMEKLGILSPAVKGKPRQVLVGMQTLEEILEEEGLI